MENDDKALSRIFGSNLGFVGPDLDPKCLQKLTADDTKNIK